VLIVEDEALIAMDIESLVERAGYRVLGAVSNVQEGLAVVEREKPTVAVLDINLGRSNVFKLADALTNLGTAIIFVTAHSQQVIPDAHKHCAVVAKPFLPETLLAAIAQCV
jgi:DNA-binding response OmpR family regulator